MRQLEAGGTNVFVLWGLKRKIENSVFENSIENQEGRGNIMARIWEDACVL